MLQGPALASPSELPELAITNIENPQSRAVQALPKSSSIANFKSELS